MNRRFEFTNIFSDEEHLRTPGFEVTPTDILSREFQQMVTYCIDQYLARPNVVGGCPQNYHFDSMPSLVVIQKWTDGEPDDERDPMVLFNPKIIGQSEPQTEYEGCGSVFLVDKDEECPPLSLIIKNTTRPAYLMVNGLNRHGLPQTHDMTGFEAVAMHHEIDHTKGKIILDVSHNLFAEQFEAFLRTGNLTSDLNNYLILYRNGDHFVIDYALDWVTRENDYRVPKASRDCAIFTLLSGANGLLKKEDFDLLEERYRVPYQGEDLPIKVGEFLRDPLKASALTMLELEKS